MPLVVNSPSHVVNNDNGSALATLIRCIVCDFTMKIEKVSNHKLGGKNLEYRCPTCGRIERVRLVQRCESLPDD